MPSPFGVGVGIGIGIAFLPSPSAPLRENLPSVPSTHDSPLANGSGTRQTTAAMPISTLHPLPRHRLPIRFRGWLWLLFVSVTLPLRAQNLVTNPSFLLGEITGWEGNPSRIGYVPLGANAWIGFSGELYQDLATEPGAGYTVEFSVQRFDPGQSWRPNHLEFSWDNRRISRIDFVEFDNRWVRLRYFLRATGTVTRLHFLGVDFPSLDTISVTRLPGGFYSGAMALPLDGSSWLEGQPIPLRSIWTSEDGGGIPTQSGFVVGGITTLASALRVGNQAEAVWSNAPVGVHYVSASMSGGYQTSPVRIEVLAQPKFREIQPSNHKVFTVGSAIPISLRLVDNEGTNKVETARILVDGGLLGRFTVTGNQIQTSWSGATEGSHEVVIIGESADGRDILRSTALIHVFRPTEPDIVQAFDGGSVSIGSADTLVQTFTAGMDGRLMAVELSGGSNSGRDDYSVKVEILDVDPVSLLPGTRILGTSQRTLAEASAASGGGMLHFAFPTNRVHLSAGKTYAIACRYIAPPSEGLFLRTSYIDALAGGRLLLRSGSTWVPATIPGSPAERDLVMTTWATPVPRPTLTLTSPSVLAGFPAGQAIPIAVDAVPGTSTSSIDRVTFFANGLELGTLTTPPFAFTWTNPPVGNHVLLARASDSDGVVGWALPVSVLSGMDAASLPRLRIEDTVSPEGNSSLPPLVFPVTLSSAAASPVTVQFSTRNLTAVAGVDYLAASGTLTFAPGQTQAFLFVRMRGDVRDEASRQLLVELRLPDGAILERPSAVGTVFDDEAGGGKPFAYQWSPLPAAVTPGVPFNARRTGIDPYGNAVASIPGGVTIGLISETGPPRLFKGPSEPAFNTDIRDTTAGYRIRPKVDVVITHLRTRGGARVALWTDIGHLEASTDFVPDRAVWQETALTHPVLIKAGTFHFITVYVGAGGLLVHGSGTEGFDLIENWGQYSQSGNVFPTVPGSLEPCVDFRFIPVEERPDLLLADLAVPSTQGSWEGPLTLVASAPRLRLVARDLAGTVGTSERLRLLPPTMSLAPDPAAMSPAFLLHVPGGYRFEVQTSPDLQTWTRSSPVLLSAGTPIPWQPAESSPPAAFFRLIAVD